MVSIPFWCSLGTLHGELSLVFWSQELQLCKPYNVGLSRMECYHQLLAEPACASGQAFCAVMCTYASLDFGPWSFPVEVVNKAGLPHFGWFRPWCWGTIDCSTHYCAMNAIATHWQNETLAIVCGIGSALRQPTHCGTMNTNFVATWSNYLM